MLARHSTTDRSRRGGALLVVITATIVMAALSAGVLMITQRDRDEHRAALTRMQAWYAAEAGAARALEALRQKANANLGAQGAQVAFADGGFHTTVVDNKNGTHTLTSVGTSDDSARAIEVVVAEQSGGVYANALFAGNASGDPAYELGFGGKKGQADQITGDVYSGGSIVLTGDSDIDGVARAISGVSGADKSEVGKSQPIPDIPGMDYPHHHDFDVAKNFEKATYKADDAGGSAWQLPEDDPAHIFRKNPSDRASDCATTTKDDYFLEDPYEPVQTDPKSDGSSAFHVTLSGNGGNPGPDGNNKVYYVDGNLWIHNKDVYSFKLMTPEKDGMKITFVVRGNIYISDNIFLTNKQKDGIALIAIKDDGEKDSGNIYFGDPVFGTLEEMHAYMYAENNFYDNNLDKAGSAEVKVVGNMTAGNQVLINRDFGTQHSKLEVVFDDRIVQGELDLPGLPVVNAGSTFVPLSWREVAPQ